MSTITRFAVRSSGRDIRVIRRPKPVVPLAELKKAELVELAEAEGVSSEGTKAELVERLGSVQ